MHVLHSSPGDLQDVEHGELDPVALGRVVDLGALDDHSVPRFVGIIDLSRFVPPQNHYLDSEDQYPTLIIPYPSTFTPPLIKRGPFN